MKNPRNENNNTYGGSDENSTKKTKLEESSSFTDQSLAIQQQIDSSSSSSSASTAEDTNKKNIEPTTTNLNPTEYDQWTKEQVASLLCAPKKVGGAGLIVDDVKPLYKAGFKGNSIDNILQFLKRIKTGDENTRVNAAVEQMVHNKDFQNVSQSTCTTVVNWIYANLLGDLRGKEIIDELRYKPENYDYEETDGDEIDRKYIRKLNFQKEELFKLKISQRELKGQGLKDFLALQIEEQVQSFEKTEGLFFKSTVSRDKQLEDFAKGILNRYTTHLLGLNRAQDNPLFEVRGPVGSGKTHFLLHATREIVSKLSENNWLEQEFLGFWSNNYIQDQITPPTNWRDRLIEAMANSIRTFASQRNGMAWNSQGFKQLTADQYIAAMIAIHHLAPTENHRFKIEEFKNTPLDLDNVIDLVIEKYKKGDNLVFMEFCIDEIQQLLVDEEGKERKTSKVHQLVTAIHTASSRRGDLLLIPIVGGTTFPSNEEDAKNNLNFVSLSGVANYIIILNTLQISKAIDLIERDFPSTYIRLMENNIEELANLLLLIGPFPRCLEMMIRELEGNNTIIIPKNLYSGVKNRLLLKYSAKHESMLIDNALEIVQILRHILEGRKGLKDTIVKKALMRGLICYNKSGIISIVFIYLHIAICDNLLLKGEFDLTFLDTFCDALLKGATHSRLMEDLIASFITFKVGVYYYLGEREVKADTFFAGARMGGKVSEVVLKLNKKMNYKAAKYCTDDKLSNVNSIDLADGTVVDMTKNPTALVVGNRWTRGDGIILFNDKQALVYETKKKKNTPCVGVNVADSFEHEQDMCANFESNIPKPFLFLYCNSGVTTTVEDKKDLFMKVASPYSMLVDGSNWTQFFRIIPKIYITNTEKRKLVDRVDFSLFQSSSPTIAVRPTNQPNIRQELEEVDFYCSEEI